MLGNDGHGGIPIDAGGEDAASTTKMAGRAFENERRQGQEI